MKWANALLAVSLVTVLSTGIASAEVGKSMAAQGKDVPAPLQGHYPVVVTDKMEACRDFYVKWFGFRVLFEASWFIYLVPGDDPNHGIAFMTPDHPSQPPGPETFDGRGVFLTLQVADAAVEFNRLKRAGVPMAYTLHDEPWGQRRFALFDPAGVWVDVVQQTQPAPGFWDKYMKR